ncbi:hypothetical protein A0Z09_001155 [Campylobacter subantarcticus]|uniref:Uncharacterized protein n=4 Tax=Campylobacter subantarcticus TaxID=497724 RepID=A0ABW9N327_9BACT|nr:hypothetical protein [Campylobacter subantarcticus]
MQKIEFEIAKGLDEWLDNENVCSFNILTKDYFKANDKDMLTSDNIKDDINTTQTHINENYNNTQELIPDNVIRIQTQDGSGEFIEIIFPSQLELNDKPLEDVSYTFVPALKGLHSMFKITSRLNSGLTRQEVVKIIEKLQKGSSGNIRLLKNKKELDELWQKLIKNATKLEEKYIPIKNHKTGQITQEKLIRYKLNDGIDIIYRTGSGSGGEAINIYGKNPKLNKTIHIKP